MLLARLNRDLLEAEISFADGQEQLDELKLVPAPRAGAAGWDPLTAASPLGEKMSEGQMRGDCLRAPSPPPSPPASCEDLSQRARGGKGKWRPPVRSRRSPVHTQPTGAVGSRTGRSAASAAARGSSHHAPRDGYSVDEEGNHHAERDDYFDRPADQVRIAVLSFLFNWPSTGGGNCIRPGWLGFWFGPGTRCGTASPAFRPGDWPQAADGLVSSEALEFDEPSWNVAEIQRRYRRAVDEFQPDFVAITDAWNMKPLLAEAVRGYRVLLLFQAQECLCPLNNLRLLGIGPTQVEQCPRNQLATPQVCHRCLAERGRHSGALHQVERALAGVGAAEYDLTMQRACLRPRRFSGAQSAHCGDAGTLCAPGVRRSVGD